MDPASCPCLSKMRRVGRSRYEDLSSHVACADRWFTDAKSFLDVYQDVHPDKPSASPAYPPSLPPLNF